MRVTFDSNIWFKLVDPARFGKDPATAQITQARDRIDRGELIPCMAETVFTLEPIERKLRAEFFGSYRPSFRMTVRDAQGNVLADEVTIGGPNHPGVHPVVEPLLESAVRAGFKLLRCPRPGLARPKLRDEWFWAESDDERAERQRVYFACVRAIEKRGAGIAHVKRIASPFMQPGDAWYEALVSVPQDQHKAVAEAIAEWADADALAAHIAYRNDYFCTRDVASKAGVGSILDADNRTWLASAYGVKIIAPEELDILPQAGA